MKEAHSGSVHDAFMVTSERQVRMLYDFLYVQLLSELAEQPYTATALAAKTELAFDSVLYRLRALHSAGLIRVVREEPRAGRAIKHYQAVARRYFMADELLRDMVFGGWREHQGAWSTLNTVLEELVPATMQHTEVVSGEALVFAEAGVVTRGRSVRTEAGVVDLLVPRDSDRALMYGVIELTPEAATELGATLQQAYQEAAEESAKTPNATKLYSLVIGLAPKPG